MQFSDAYTEHSSKHRDYFPIYDNIFSNNGIDREKSYKILEIGVDIGSGVRALKKYFPNSEIYGLDIKEECKKHEEENINIIIGSQVSKDILEELSKKEFDIIIDDGSHHNNHVFKTFEYLFKSLNTNNVGLYIVEDIHTSYWPYYGGGYKNPNSSIEKFKNLIDQQNLWCIRDPISCHIPPYKGVDVEKTYCEKWLEFIQFYENIIVIKKRKKEARCSKPI
mgnify:FL=1|tara:strand:- start:1482 stop:2147 length:666 start_codon:yes stop_codon:yes gene_type:complete